MHSPLSARCLLSYLALAIAPLLRAQVTLPVFSSYALPVQHSYILGATAVADGSGGHFRLLTISEIWAAHSLESATWTKAGQIGGYRLHTLSQAAAHPSGAAYLYTTIGPGSSTWLLELNINNNEVRGSNLNDIVSSSAIRGMAVAPDLRLYVSTPAAILIYPDLTTTTAATVISNFGSQPLGISSGYPFGTLLAFAHETLFAFDRVNQRVLRYDADGNFLSEFAVANGAGFSTFTVSNTNLLFTADFSDSENPYGTIYDSATGGVVGHFDLPYDVDDTESNGGKPQLAVVGNLLIATSGNGANIYLYDISGLSTVPEPSTYALFVGLAILGMTVLNRRKS